MRYCSNCQVLIRDDDRCPSCGSGKLRDVRQNDPVLLMTVGEEESDRIDAAFDEAGISHERRMSGTGSPLSQLYGRAPYSSCRIFVPYGELDRCREILGNIGVLDEKQEKSEPCDAQEGGGRSAMSPAKRILIRVVSAIAFFSLIWAVVAAADTIVHEFQSFFR